MQMCDIDSIWREIKVSRPKGGTKPRTNFGEITFHTGVRTQTILELTNLEATLRQWWCKYYISWCSYKLKVQHICPDFNDFKCNVWKGNFSGCLFFRLSSDCAAAAGDLCFQAVIGNWQISSASKRGGRGKGIVQNRMKLELGKKNKNGTVCCPVFSFNL